MAFLSEPEFIGERTLFVYGSGAIEGDPQGGVEISCADVTDTKSVIFTPGGVDVTVTPADYIVVVPDTDGSRCKVLLCSKLPGPEPSILRHPLFYGHKVHFDWAEGEVSFVRKDKLPQDLCVEC